MQTPPPQQPVLVYTLSDHCSSHAWPKGEKALIRELRHSGYDVHTISGESVLTDSADLNFDKDQSVVQIVKPPHSAFAHIDIWFYQKSKNRVWHAAINDLETTTQEAAVVAALKFNELYPTKLEKVTAMPDHKDDIDPKPQNSNQGTPPIKEQNSEQLTKLQIGFGVASIAYFSTAPMRAGPLVQLVWMPSERISLSLQIAMGIWGKSLSLETHRATLRHYNLTMHLDYIFRSHGVVRPFVGIFLGGSRFQTKGSTNMDLTPIEEQGNSFTSGVQTGIAFTFSNQLSIIAAASIATLLPDVEIYFGQTSVARYGRFLGNTSLAVRLHF